ncbi:CGNR zinc finger domain-containing protein [[Actinomadura] parvosata]|uniref:CGNR zinc finger domain-containing protein n=1 Tax=[Actinomadura] parvosata TaxID=1955412 RepID=UPI00406C7CD4
MEKISTLFEGDDRFRVVDRPRADCVWVFDRDPRRHTGPGPIPQTLTAQPAKQDHATIDSYTTSVDVTCTEADLRRARRLREAIQRVGQALASDVPPSREDIDLVNAMAAEPPSAPELSADAASVRWHGDGVAAVLSLVARDLITLCGSEHRARVRVCANPACGIPFVDTSRVGTRRWCSMKTCGALAEKRAYRARARAGAGAE